MKALQPLESSLNDLFVKSAPELPKGGKDFLVQYLPWLTLLGGLLSAWVAWGLYEWARVANHFADYANSLNAAFGQPVVDASRWTIGIYAGLIIMAITAVLYILAFKPLQGRKKTGWDLVFYALILNVIYNIVLLFSDYGGGVGSLVGSVIGFAIGGYLLFQVRSSYAGMVAAKSSSKPTMEEKK